MTPITVIINCSAGNGHDDPLAQRLREQFAAQGMQAEVILARGGEEIIAAARTAVQQGAAIVAAGGGDGTMNAVASVVAGSATLFGVLPMGTLNHFAKDLGIPLGLDEAIRTVATGKPLAVDVGDVNERLFLNNSSLGLYPDIVRDRERQQRRLGRGKWLAALWATIAALRRYPFLAVRLTLEHAEHLRYTPFVFVGNNEYTMEGFSIGERSRLDSGKLSLYVAHRTGRLGLVRLAWRALWGRLAQESDFDVLTTQAMLIDTHKKRIRVATDGEVTVMLTPLRYRIHPGALKVIVPA